MVALATLMYEILITRIFSLTMSYHFAFMAISLAMFGMTVGAIWVYLRPDDSTPADLKFRMAISALLFGVSAVASVLVHSVLPVFRGTLLVALALITFTYVVISVPFVFSGVCVCLALTKYPRHVSKLYATDLAGAASGCVLLIYTLRITDGPTAVVFVAFLACLGSALVARGGSLKRLHLVSVVASSALAIFVAVNTILVQSQDSLLRLRWVKGEREGRPLYEKWNSFSRIAVAGDPNSARSPLTEGVSPTYPADRKVRELSLTIDAAAETTLTAFDGDLSPLEYLKYDVKNFVHYLRPNSDVLVIGAGGGRDVLAALAFGQRSVRAVEINEDILNTVNRRFGAFTGHLDTNPKLTFVNDEARSYIARLNERFDIIQISFIDTWAATAAGGFGLTENSLYTVEAWKLFLQRLTPQGVLSVSRWYFPELPGEAYRLTSLAATALRQEGVANPSQHLVLVRNVLRPRNGGPSEPAGTILVSLAPFSSHDLDKVEAVAQKMQFAIVLSPRFALDSTFSSLASGKNLDSFLAQYPLKISPPTDDSPFFFNMLRFRDTTNPARWGQGHTSLNFNAVIILVVMLVVVIALSILAILVPLSLTVRKETLRAAAPHFMFFAAIGLGFMLIEVSQMQRLIIFLGHPTYALSVVLFALLLSAGLGSYSTQRVNNPAALRSGIGRLLLLLAVLMVFGAATSRVIQAYQASTTTTRIVAAVGILFPLGLTMGAAFPLGLKLAAHESDTLTPWLWGINGATSVCASVLAVAIALHVGISAAYWAGSSCYVVACGAYAWASQRILGGVASGREEAH
jgi:hypothetical protein